MPLVCTVLIIIGQFLFQGQILAAWILTAKLPNSDLNFAVDVLLCFFPRNKSTQKSPANSPGNLIRKIPLESLQKLLLDYFGSRDVKITSQKFLIVLELFLGAVILTGDLSDFRTVFSGELGL